MSSFLSLREGLDIQLQKLEAWIILSTLCIAMLLPIYFLMTFWAECLYLAVKTWINFGLGVVALCAGFAIITSFLYLVRKCLGLGEGVIVPIVRACIEVIFTIYGLYSKAVPVLVVKPLTGYREFTGRRRKQNAKGQAVGNIRKQISDWFRKHSGWTIPVSGRSSSCRIRAQSSHLCPSLREPSSIT